MQKRSKVLVIFLVGLLDLSGCTKKQDILAQPPVIPLTVADVSKAEQEAVMQPAENADSKEKIDETEKNKTVEDKEETGNTVSSLSVSENSEKETANGTIVESTQLSDKELDEFTDFFNSEQINGYLRCSYEIPSQIEETEDEQQKISCVAGSVDTTGLYSIFYTKGDESSLWNVVFKKNAENRYFYSNTKLTN